MLEKTTGEAKTGTVRPEQLRSVYRMTSRIIEESDIRILIYKTTFYNLIVERKIDFYNCKIQLNARQAETLPGVFYGSCMQSSQCTGLYDRRQNYNGS